MQIKALYRLHRPLLRLQKAVPTKIVLFMKLTAILIFTAMLQVNAAGTFAQTVSYTGRDVPLTEIFSAIRKQTAYTFFYRNEDLEGIKPLRVTLRNVPLETALEQILEGQPLSFEIQGKTIFIRKKAVPPPILPGLQEPVKGVVRDQDGRPLANVNILVKGSNKGTTTNADGSFTIDAAPGGKLLISYVGYNRQEIDVTGNAGINITLTVSTSSLDEVQIQAYGTTSRRTGTGNVSTVQAKEIGQSPVNNPLMAIAGRVPGVFIEQTSGVPGAGIKINIQGENSLNYASEPFYVIDGVPYTAQMMPGLGDPILGRSGSSDRTSNAPRNAGNPLSFINPQDIESISVLKDADATSIYGSRASNGAIIITTKKAKSGHMAVQLNVQQGGGKVTSRLNMLNTQQYLEMRREALANDNRTLDPNDLITQLQFPDLLFWDERRYTNWQKELVGGIANFTAAQASVSGGNGNVQYLLNAGLQQDGTVTKSDLRDRKASLHLNLSGNSDNKRFRFGFTGNYLSSDNKLASVHDVATRAFYLPPNAPALYQPDGSLNWELMPGGRASFDNPMASLERAYINKTSNLIASLQLGYTLLPGLELKASFGYNELRTSEVTTSPHAALQPFLRPRVKRASKFNTANIKSWIIEPQLTYHRSIGAGTLDFLLGATVQQEDRDRQLLEAVGFTSDAAMLNIKAAASVTVGGSPDAVILSTYKYNALFSRLNYNLLDRYIFSATIRRDGSSRFGSENRFHNFASVAGAWIFTNEPFLSGRGSLLSFGKLRASFGSTGNDQIGDYAYLNLYGNTPTYGSSYQGIIGLEPMSGFPNPYLQWESTQKLSSTLDLGLLADRVLLSFTYYRNTSSNQLSFTPLPDFTGGIGVNENRAVVTRNRGFEIGLNTSNIKKGQFSWTSSVNLTIPSSKLVGFNDARVNEYIPEELIGRSLSVTRLFRFAGVDPQTGAYTFLDKNGQRTSEPNYDEDRTVFLDLAPRFFGGMQHSFQYRQFSLDLLFQFVKQYSRSEVFGFNPGSSASNQLTVVLDRWQKPGDIAAIQQYDTDNSHYMPWYYAATASDKLYTDGGYIRMKNVSLGYQFREDLIKRAGFKQARIYVNGQNLLTFTNYVGTDPETRTISGIPPLKVLTLGIQATF